MTRLPGLEEALVAAARRAEPQGATARSTRRRRPARLLVAVLLGVLTLGGIAVAATQLIQTGEPVPPNPQDHSFLLGKTKPGTTRLLSLRVADPDGGPPWGMRVFRTIVKTPPNGARRDVACTQTGRVVDGKLGVIGKDGSFNNDGKFHELPVQADGCGGLDARGQLFFQSGSNAQVASGDPREAACETAAQRKGRTMDTVRSLQAALRLQLKRGERQAARIQRRVIARYQRRARLNIPLCPAADLRTIVYGMAGSQATRVTLAGGPSMRPVARESGAWMFVLSGRRHNFDVRTRYRGGISCGTPTRVTPDPRCSPPPGFAADPTQRPKQIKPPPPALNVPITALKGMAIRFTAPYDNHRYTIVLRCPSGALFFAQTTRPAPAGKPLTVRVRPPGCRTRRGTIIDQSDGRTIGHFTLNRPAHP